MSEFREATAAVAALSTRLQALRAASERLQGPNDVIDVDEVVLEAQDALEFVRGALEGETNASMERFRARCATVDPVTQAPRFGPKMMDKVTAMLEEYDAMKLEVEESGLLVSVADRIGAVKSERRERERQAEEQRARAEREEREAKAAEQRRREREEQERQQREEAAERERVAALARAAQLKREQRERTRQDEERRARKEQERLEALRKTFQPGKEALGRAMDMLRESTGSESAYRNAVDKLLAVVSNVVASPENAAFRHIPKDNASFHADIGQFDGGHQSLLAMGFRELQQDDKTVFVLEEPDLSEDLDKWSEWFDGLKEMQEFIDSRLQTK